MKIRLFTAISLFLIFIQCSTTNSSLKETTSEIEWDIKRQARWFAADKLGKLYLLDAFDQLYQYSPQYQFLYKYNNNRLGRFSSVDVSNPQKILLHYNRFDHIVILDTYLGVTQTMDLTDWGFNNIPVACLSNDNNIWLYDPADFTLHKLSDRGERIANSFSLVDQNLGHVRPKALIESGNYVLLHDPDSGVLMFDNLGQFIRLLPLLDISELKAKPNFIYYKRDKKYYRYHLKAFAERQIELPESLSDQEIKVLHLEAERNCFLMKGGLKCF